MIRCKSIIAPLFFSVGTLPRTLMAFLLFWGTAGHFSDLTGQNTLKDHLQMNGRVFHTDSLEPMAYAHIMNHTQNTGTVSNSNGYFKIPITDFNDSVTVSFLGYKTHAVSLEKGRLFYEVKLERKSQSLSEVVIIAPDDEVLYDLMNECRKNNHRNKNEAKGYFELKSFVENEQIELVEGFYNLDLRGYDVYEQELKAGRTAVRPMNGRMFASLQTSKAVTMHQTFDQNGHFPDNPFAVSKRKMKKEYRVELDHAYKEDGDSVYVINFTPKDSATDDYFSGTAWINVTEKELLKLRLEVRDTKNHPFIPLTEGDELINAGFTITKTFHKAENGRAFRHTDFNYFIDYLSKGEEEPFRIETQAVLYAYDYRSLFKLPKLDLPQEEPVSDYQKISAMPFNDFFWEMNTEFQLMDHEDQNKAFYEDPETVTGESPAPLLALKERGAKGRVYVYWNTRRFKINELKRENGLNRLEDPTFLTNYYDIKLGVYLDVTSYGDSNYVSTATVLDPYETYYDLPVDNTVQCFINMFFDVYEIERRKLHLQVQKVARDPEKVERLYSDFLERMEEKRHNFIMEVERGYNEKKMVEWNSLIKEKLNIDNLSLFELYSNNKQ